MLKNSDRNCSFLPSTIRKSLNIDVSMFTWFAVVMVLRPALPNVPNAGSVKAALLNQLLAFWFAGTSDTPGTTSGRESPVLQLHKPRPRMVRGVPVLND